MARRKRFGEILVEAGLVTEEVLAAALESQKGTGKRLGQVLEEMGIVTERDIAVAVARQFGFKTVQDIAKYGYPKEVLELVDSTTALNKSLFPLKTDQNTLYLAMVNPLDMEIIDDLSFKTGLRIVPCVTTPAEIQAAVQRHYLEKMVDSGARDWWTILTVEDQDIVRSAIVAVLKKEGYKILEANNGAEGLAEVCRNRPHLILADTLMPRMDGYEMFRALQAQADTRSIPVIAVTSRCTPEEEAKLLDMGYFDFIAKPINPIRLAARVKRALRQAYGAKLPSSR